MTPWAKTAILEKMPGRIIPLVNQEIYHIFNRGISLQPTFLDKRDYQRLLQTIVYYQNQQPSVKLSRFLILSEEERKEIIDNNKKAADFLTDIICFCFMPNHLHFLLKQVVDGGISKFMSNVTNSYTRYLNTKRKRNGPLFQGKFKAVRVESDEQLLHLSRYIHLNPLTSYVIKDIGQLENYVYSSFPEYMGKIQSGFCQKEIVLGQFKGPNDYRKFVLDQVDYQRRLQEIKHLVLERGSNLG